MALTPQLYGFGGIKITVGTHSVEFDSARGFIKHIPNQEIISCVNGGYAANLKCWNVEIILVDLMNILENEYLKYQMLIYALNAMKGLNQTATVVPRNDSTITPLEYECFLNGDFLPEDINKGIEMGQVTELEFLCADPLDEIQAKFGTITEDTVLTGDDDETLTGDDDENLTEG